MQHAALRWSDPACLRAAAGPSAGHPQQIVARGSGLELIHAMLHTPDIARFQLCGDDCGTVLNGEDLRLLFRAPGIATLFPSEGDEANAAIVGARLAEPIRPPLYRGAFAEACRQVGLLAAGDRAAAFVITHDEIYAPRRLQAMQAAR